MTEPLDDPLFDQEEEERELSEELNQAIKEESRALVVPSWTPFEIMDRLDDQLIVKEMRGLVADAYVYDVEGVIGLSKAGVDDACNYLAKQGEAIRELEQEWRDEGDYAYFTIKAGRYAISREGREVLLDTAFGAKRQWKKIQKRDGSVVPNPFWFEQGMMKAARNARKRLIPEKVIAQLITAYRDKGKVKTVKGKAKSKTQKRGGKAAAEKPKDHWGKHSSGFWAWAQKEKALTASQVHEALGVKSLYDYKGTMKEAKRAIENWIGEHLA